MDKKRAREILIANSCCSFTNAKNNLCELCPWNNTKDCGKTAINEDLIIESVSILSGFSITKMKLDEIKVTSAFTISNPNKNKLDMCRKYWNTFHRQDRFIVVNQNGYLQDGYCMYLILKENGIEEAEVKLINGKGIGKKKKNKVKARYTPKYRNEPTTYVYGYHPESESKRELIWRIPKNDKWTWFKENLRVGDKITCRTKYGDKPVVVTKIETLDKCPVDLAVKRVKNTEIMRGGYNVVP